MHVAMVVGLLVLCAASVEGANTGIDVEKHSFVICKQPGRYIGWPCIAKTPSGELLVVFSGDRDAHVCPHGKTQLVRSRDGGKTWSGPETINDTPLDDRDAGIAALRDGTLLVRWFTLYVSPTGWNRHLDLKGRTRFERKVTSEDIDRWGPVTGDKRAGRRGHWLRRSTDNGKTWEATIRVAGTSPKPPIELADGRLLMIGNNCYDRVGKTSRVVVEESTDKGRTWRVIATLGMFPDDQGAYLGEPHMVEAAPGHIVAMIRHERRPRNTKLHAGYLHQADSTDGGRTWTDWRKTAIWGKPPHLLKLADGRLLVSYGHRRKPYGQRACISADGGKTWDYAREILIRDDAPNGDLGYPASVQMDDDTILTVYYQIDKPGEKPCLMGTFWKLPKGE